MTRQYLKHLKYQLVTYICPVSWDYQFSFKFLKFYINTLNTTNKVPPGLQGHGADAWAGQCPATGPNAQIIGKTMIAPSALFAFTNQIQPDREPFCRIRILSVNFLISNYSIVFLCNGSQIELLIGL